MNSLLTIATRNNRSEAISALTIVREWPDTLAKSGGGVMHPENPIIGRSGSRTMTYSISDGKVINGDSRSLLYHTMSSLSKSVECYNLAITVPSNCILGFFERVPVAQRSGDLGSFYCTIIIDFSLAATQLIKTNVINNINSYSCLNAIFIFW